MLRLRVEEILEEQGKSRYWLYKGLGMGWQNFRSMISNQTKSIRYEMIEEMCIALNVTPNELFEWDFEEE
jgi:putative transcriptional regulator